MRAHRVERSRPGFIGVLREVGSSCNQSLAGECLVVDQEVLLARGEIPNSSAAS
jgi:hypothetical protein